MWKKSKHKKSQYKKKKKTFWTSDVDDHICSPLPEFQDVAKINTSIFCTLYLSPEGFIAAQVKFPWFTIDLDVL